MNDSSHPQPELTAVLRHVARRCLVEGHWGADALDEVVETALKPTRFASGRIRRAQARLDHMETE